MELAIPKAVELKVRIQEPELVVPVKKTPHELKPLSDIDDQEGFRFFAPVIMLYENVPLMKGRDPVKVIRQALGQALVYYHPFAGRLVEGPNRKLLVDCTGEGVLFIEADAYVKIEQLGDTIHPPFPYLEELLHDVPGSTEIIGCPLLLIQITRFLCGGFVFALRVNHTMSDVPGLVQFLNAIADFAKGEAAPSVLPVWRREILNARSTPQITCVHHEYDQPIYAKGSLANDDIVQRSFFFGPKEVKAIQNHLPLNQRTNFSSFELIVACVWRCRTIALRFDPDETVRLSCFRNIRGKYIGLQLPFGYYGNALAYPAAVSKAKMLCESSLEFALELIREAKDRMNKEYIKSVADLMVSKGRPIYTKEGHFLVSDNRYLGLDNIDFGWGKPLFGGVSGAISFISCLLHFKSKNGVEGILMPICLPLPAMKRFGHELQKMIQEPNHDLYVKSDHIITSKF